MSDEYYDEDGYRLAFEDDTADPEKQFFMRAFPNVDKISERKVHCTSCYMHIGTAPISEAIIRMHPVLRVTHCRNCHTFYNSGEFDKGEDGSELYCRWCGQGGEVYCCSKCPYVFCKKCIVQNLSRACVQDISRNDNWQCFSCAPKIMWHLRAQHWALINYIEKQKKEMKDKNLPVQAINNAMKQDNTTCCSNKGLNKKGSTPISAKKAQKRTSDASDLSPGAAKIPEKRIAPKPMALQQQQQSPPSKKSKTDNNEVVCTPDIMSMFMNPEEPPPLVTNRAAPVPPRPIAPATRQVQPNKPAPAPTPAPGPARQVVVRPNIPATINPVMRMPVNTNPTNATPPPPVYHTINGYRIDLHTAAQQGTYRLPNGKLIQVRKQAPTTPTPPPPVVPARNNLPITPKPPNNAYFNSGGMFPQNQGARMTNGNTNVHINMALQQQQQLQEQRLQQQRQQQQLIQQQQQQRQQQQQQQTQMIVPPGQPTPTIVAGQPNPALQLPTLALLQSMVNGPHEDSPLGRSRKNFEGKLLSGVEICQHIVNKINTLTNSNSFKNIRNVRDLKELYIHVSYLLTYAIGRFKTLQEKCVDDVKKMGFTKESDFVMMGEQISNRNPDEDKSDDEDDCEIIEQNTTLIELDSEDEEEGGRKKKDKEGANKAPSNRTETEAAVAAILSSTEQAEDLDAPITIVDSEPNVHINEDDQVDKSSESVTVEPEVSEAQKKNDNLASSKENTSDENTQDGDTAGISTSSTISVVAVSDSEKNDQDDDDLVEIIDNAQKESASEKEMASEVDQSDSTKELMDITENKKDSTNQGNNTVNPDSSTDVEVVSDEEVHKEAEENEDSVAEKINADNNEKESNDSEKNKTSREDAVVVAEDIVEATITTDVTDTDANTKQKSLSTEDEVMEIDADDGVPSKVDPKSDEKDKEDVCDKEEPFSETKETTSSDKTVCDKDQAEINATKEALSNSSETDQQQKDLEEPVISLDDDDDDCVVTTAVEVEPCNKEDNTPKEDVIEESSAETGQAHSDDQETPDEKVDNVEGNTPTKDVIKESSAETGHANKDNQESPVEIIDNVEEEVHQKDSSVDEKEQVLSEEQTDQEMLEAADKALSNEEVNTETEIEELDQVTPALELCQKVAVEGMEVDDSNEVVDTPAKDLNLMNTSFAEICQEVATEAPQPDEDNSIEATTNNTDAAAIATELVENVLDNVQDMKNESVSVPATLIEENVSENIQDDSNSIPDMITATSNNLDDNAIENLKDTNTKTDNTATTTTEQVENEVEEIQDTNSKPDILDSIEDSLQQLQQILESSDEQVTSSDTKESNQTSDTEKHAVEQMDVDDDFSFVPTNEQVNTVSGDAGDSLVAELAEITGETGIVENAENVLKEGEAISDDTTATTDTETIPAELLNTVCEANSSTVDMFEITEPVGEDEELKITSANDDLITKQSENLSPIQNMEAEEQAVVEQDFIAINGDC